MQFFVKFVSDSVCVLYYNAIIREAKGGRETVQIHYISHDFLKNDSQLLFYSSIRPGSKVGDPQVVDLRVIQYLPDGNIKYKLQFSEDWQDFPCQSFPKPGCQNMITQLYTSQLPIKVDKFNDLQSLKHVILSDFHSFYDNLRKGDK